MDRQPFPIVVENFRKNFKGGLNGRYLEEHERCFKQKAHEDFSTRLNQAEFDRLMKDGDWTELASRIKKSHTINLLGSFEIIKFSDVLKDPNTQEDISCGLYDLLYGKDDISERFMRYAGVLARYELDKWPIITLPLFLCFPDQYMFIKPTVTQEAAANRGFDIQYDSQINWNTFNQVQKFSNDLFERLKAYSNPELNPRDMIDVQTFMWCTFTKGYTAEEIQKAQQH